MPVAPFGTTAVENVRLWEAHAEIDGHLLTLVGKGYIPPTLYASLQAAISTQFFAYQTLLAGPMFQKMPGSTIRATGNGRKKKTRAVATTGNGRKTATRMRRASPTTTKRRRRTRAPAAA